jgi:hypothetical protein
MVKAVISHHFNPVSKIQPKLVIKPKGIISHKNRGFYVVYDKKHQIIASNDKGELAYKEALKKGYSPKEISIGFNNKNKSICLW